MDTKIYFRRAKKVAVDEWDENSSLNFAEVASLDANLRALGFALDDRLAERLLHAPVEVIKSIHNELIAEAKEIKGVRRYNPMYPNFPRQVMAAPEAELYINAIMHYFGDVVGLRITPAYEKLARPELDFDKNKVTVVGLGSDEDYQRLVGNIFTSKSAFSPTDRDDIKSLSDEDFAKALVVTQSKFENRENKAVIVAEAMSRRISVTKVNFDTATDVLRLAVALSDGDVSLADKTHFRSFKRSERRVLLNLLNVIDGDIVEDMLRHQSAWKRLGERLHPGEFKHLTKMQEAFQAVRTNSSAETFNSKVETFIKVRQPVTAARLLAKRPGEFARRLDKVVRLASSRAIANDVINEFEKVAKQVSPTVLIQARNNFVTRGNTNSRVFFPKGSVARFKSLEDERDVISRDHVTRIINIIDDALANAFASRGDLGGAWVDPALKGVAVPFGLRNASASAKTLGRGSRLSLGDDTNVIRFFTWWKDGTYRTDIDLSAVTFDKDFNYVDAIAYYNLRESGAVHSGDITSAPNGASEFIDIEIDTLRRRGVRYVAMTQHVYSGQNFDELPECFAGFMERRDLDSGEIYDPRTVTNKADITAKSRAGTPFIFDLESREAIWVDLTMKVGGGGGNVANTKGKITSVVEAMATLSPPSLYDLFTAHATARGGVVSKEKAKTIFSFDGDVTPFDVEVILSEYL